MGFSLGSLTSAFKGAFTGSGIRNNLLTGGLYSTHKLNTGGNADLKNGLFPDKPEVPEAPPAPTLDAGEAAAEDKAAQLRRRRGMAATILGGMDTTQPTTQAASLLGS